jgi:tRNA pseudouridine55 synthase
MDGFINLNKPQGFTSHDCVAKLRRLLKTKKIGHAGTLDPLATGVLPMAIGRATRLLPFLPSDKAYRAVVRFGMTTNTDDLEGTVLTQVPVPTLERTQVEACLPHFLGTLEQIPPRYSAIQVGGKRLYDLARRGEAVEVPVRTVSVNKIDVVAWQPGEFPEITLDIACGAGTYIRSIARDLGEKLGVGATLAGLVRSQSSGFTLDTSLSLETIAQQTETNTLTLIPPEQALQTLPKVTLSATESRAWCMGQIVQTSLAWPVAQPLQVINETPDGTSDGTSTLLGVGIRQSEDTPWQLVAKVVLTPVG